MMMVCDSCGEKIHPDDNFCCYCGSDAPRKTVKGEVLPKEIEQIIYCPSCSVKNSDDALFCSSCGEDLFKKPISGNIYCPSCCEVNSLNANICCRCSESLKDWFSLSGKSAEKHGYKGDLVLKEKMTGCSYKFLTKDEITIGRAPSNDIVIPCSWVSGSHLLLNRNEDLLIDNGSSNSTFVNRSGTPISRFPFSTVTEFNVAGSFTFRVIKNSPVAVIWLGAIIDEDECRKNGNGNVFDELRKTYYILGNSDCDINIGKTEGAVHDVRKVEELYYTLSLSDGYYYYSDADRKVDKTLIFAKGNNLPVNWEIMK